MKAVDFKHKMAVLSKDYVGMAKEFKQGLMDAYIDDGIVTVYSPENLSRVGRSHYTPYTAP